MPRYRINGYIPVSVTIELEANSREEAEDLAFDEYDMLSEYAGNGGYDKLVGTDRHEVSLSADGTLSITDIEEIEE